VQVILGATATVKWTPSAADGTIALAVRLPSGVVLDPAPTVTGTAPATASFNPSAPGRHLLTWSRVDGDDVEVHVDVLDVWPADPHYLISIDDAAAAVAAGLGGVAIPATQRADLPLYVAAASLVIEDQCGGPLTPQERTYKADGGRPVLLPEIGVSVVSVAVYGSVRPASSYTVDAAAGIIYGLFPRGLQNVTVTYLPASAALPANLQLAVREQLRFLWQTARHGVGNTAQEVGYTPAGYAIPYMVQGLCGAHPKAPGIR
jgi:hypothetical protein